MTPDKIDKVLDSTIDVLYSRASSVIEQARETAYRQINEALVKRNWELGKLIAEEELNGQDRAIYGASIIKGLSKRLTVTYGKKALPKQISIVSRISTKCFRRFSTQRVENLRFSFLGVIIALSYRNLMQMPVHGMNKRLCSKAGVSALFSVM